jgi:hypothetical protein
MLRVALALMAGLAALPAAADEPPPALIEATEAASALCRTAGGVPEILAGYDTVIDLNGDGRDDHLTDLAKLQCSGAWDAFCGASGCPVAAWLSEPDGGHVRFDLGRLTGFSVRDGGGPLPEVVAGYAATACGADAVEGCTRTWRFASNAPEMPPVDAAAAAGEASAAAPEPEALTGWTLRSVPGASPVALGAGTGNIASLAAFCLEGQPFLALTFHERPEAESVALGFDFSQGRVEASAGFEETAGGAYVVALADGALAARLGGRDSEVEVGVDGRPEGTLSLSGSTRALRGALADCGGL